MKSCTGHSLLQWTFLLLIALELTLVCPTYAVLDHYDVLELPCDSPSNEHDHHEGDEIEEADRCLICVVKSSGQIFHSEPEKNIFSVHLYHVFPQFDRRSPFLSGCSIRPPPASPAV